MFDASLRRAIVFNDAGSAMLKARHYGAARDLFAGALQTFQLGAVAVRDEEDSQATRLLATAATLRQAEIQLLAAVPNDSVDPVALHSEQEQAEEELQREVSSFPWIVEVPFKVQLPTLGDEDTEAMLHFFDLSIAKVLFNIGLSHQLMQEEDQRRRNAEVVPSYYHMSSASLSNVPDSSETLFLALAVMNNFAIWCFNTGDGGGLGSCMDQMDHLLDEEAEHPIEDEPSLNAIRSNIRLLRDTSSGMGDSNSRNPRQEDNGQLR